MNKKLFSVVLAVLMMAVCVSGVMAQDAIKIGGTGPLTGGAAIYGNAVANAAKIAVDEINAKGGQQYELRYEDDAHDAEKAVNAFNALIDWGMQVSMSSVTSKPAEATSEINMEERIFGMTPSASSTAVTEGKDNVLQICFTDPSQGTAAAQYIVSHNMASKVAVIWKNDDVYSKGIYDTFMAKSEELGLEVVSDTTFNDGNDTDFSVQIADAQEKGAELVFLPMYYTPASLILAQANAAGYAPTFFGVDGMDGILTMEGFDASLAEGVVLLTPFDASASDEKTVAFVAKYQELYGETPNQFAADGYDVVYALVAAMEAAGVTPDMSAEEINDALIATFETFTFNGITGDNMTWSNGAVSKDAKAVVIENGVYVSFE